MLQPRTQQGNFVSHASDISQTPQTQDTLFGMGCTGGSHPNWVRKILLPICPYIAAIQQPVALLAFRHDQEEEDEELVEQEDEEVEENEEDGGKDG